MDGKLTLFSRGTVVGVPLTPRTNANPTNPNLDPLIYLGAQVSSIVQAKQHSIPRPQGTTKLKSRGSRRSSNEEEEEEDDDDDDDDEGWRWREKVKDEEEQRAYVLLGRSLLLCGRFRDALDVWGEHLEGPPPPRLEAECRWRGGDLTG